MHTHAHAHIHPHTHLVNSVDIDALAEMLLHLRQPALPSGVPERGFRLPHGVRGGE